jgi:hypothetical protein
MERKRKKNVSNIAKSAIEMDTKLTIVYDFWNITALIANVLNIMRMSVSINIRRSNQNSGARQSQITLEKDLVKRKQILWTNLYSVQLDHLLKHKTQMSMHL